MLIRVRCTYGCHVNVKMCCRGDDDKDGYDMTSIVYDMMWRCCFNATSTAMQ